MQTIEETPISVTPEVAAKTDAEKPNRVRAPRVKKEAGDKPETAAVIEDKPKP